MDLCIFCTLPFRARQEGLQCDDCQHWQQRRCQTGISQQEYRVADNPLESTRLEDDLYSTVFDPPASPVEFNVDATLISLIS